MPRSEPGPIGVIGEDETDCAALRVLIKRMAGERTRVERRYGNGCAEIFRKASAWMHELAKAGCTHVVLLHDLDRDPRNGQLKDERALRARLEALAHPRGIARLVCIPVEELEAWFWSDPAVLEKVARRKVEASQNPHTVPKPKEKLMALSRSASGAARYTTADNKDLAEKLDLQLCAARCPAFRDLARFIGAPL
jgi:hypothetical protein